MRLRLFSIAFLFASLATGLTWLLLLPVVLRLAHVVRVAPVGPGDVDYVRGLSLALPIALISEVLVLALGGFALLHWMLGRPLAEAERSVTQLGRLDLELPLQESGGPILSRLQRSLRRTGDALRAERELTLRQLKDLQAVNTRLSTAYTELAAAERLATVGKLAAGVAHEIGNPLSGILGYLSLLRTRAGPHAELVQFVDLLEAEVGRIDRIVRGLLDLGRPTRTQRIPVHLLPLAETCASLVGKGPDFEGVRIDQRIDPAAVLVAEPGPLSQILINLLLNAAQAMEGRGTITLRSRLEGRRLVLEVDDTGPGIAPEALPHLFEPFFTTKSPGKGTGLGLAVSSHLAYQLGGELRAENLPAGGARFSLTLEAQ